jgi:hypothetical protein
MYKKNPRNWNWTTPTCLVDQKWCTWPTTNPKAIDNHVQFNKKPEMIKTLQKESNWRMEEHVFVVIQESE